MNASFINPFLTSSVHVIEMMVQIKPSIGALEVKKIEYNDKYIWLRIGIYGQLEKDVFFGFPEHIVMQVVSIMMGGMNITALDELCTSAIAELGNMISGNASTLLSENGFNVDITPPDVVNETSLKALWGRKAFRIPLQMESIGEFEINIMV